MDIRTVRASDADDIWRIFHAVVAAGDTYPFPIDAGREVALDYFLKPGVAAWVAVIDGTVAGVCKVVPNWGGPASHVANASFMVDPAVRRQGVGRAMGEHCLREARKAGYLAMQFNFVVSTNTAAVALWRDLGFAIVGILPKAFRHARLGYVDAYVMYCTLDGA